jgi:hypothetical protein
MQEIADSLEDAIDSCVSMASFPPAFDNSGIVPMYKDVAANVSESGKGVYKELKSHCFSPPDISFTIVHLPAWYESPRSPTFSNDDSNSNA